MKYTVEELSQIKRKIMVDVPQSEVQQHRQKLVKKVQRTAKFKGFRPGKAPLSLVESNYGPQIDMDCVEELLNRFYPEVLGQCGLNPIGVPKFDFEKFDLKQDFFTFSVEFEIQPTIELDPDQYKGLGIKEPDFKVDEKLMQDTLNRLLDTKATFTEVKRRRTAKVDDTVVADYQTFDGDTPLEDLVENYEFDLTQGALLAPIEKALIGSKLGEKVEALVDFDENARTEIFRGKRVRFDIMPKALKEKQRPELTDEFVKESWPEVDSVDALKEKLATSLNQRQEEQGREVVRQQIIKQVAKLGDFEVPVSLVRAEQENMVRRFREYMQQDGIGEIPGLDENTLLSEVEAEARFKVRAGMVLARIGQQENIEVKDEDIEQELLKQAGDSPVEQVREFFVKNNLMGRLADSVLEDKILLFLKDNAKLDKIAPEELDAFMTSLDEKAKEETKAAE